MKKLLISSLLLLSTMSLFAGIGGSAGGPGVSSWAPALEKGLIRDWPHVRLSENRTIELHEVCIKDDTSLKTLKRYGSSERISFNKKNWRHKIIDRVFDAKNCYSAWDPKCSIANQYVGEVVRVPVYRGKPLHTRGGEESLRDFFSRSSNNLQYFETFTIPKCRK